MKFRLKAIKDVVFYQRRLCDPNTMNIETVDSRTISIVVNEAVKESSVSSPSRAHLIFAF